MMHGKIKNIEDKIPDITNMATKNNLNAKTEEFKGEIPSIPNLTTKTALNAVQSEIPSFSNLLKKTDYNIKVNEIEIKITDLDHNKYIITLEFNKLTSKNFAARLN